MKKNTVALLFVMSSVTGMTAANGVKGDTPVRQDVIVVYENDVHCAVDGYSKFAALRNEKKKLTPYVATVSNGDFMQGDLMGAMTEGTAIVKIMNAVGYDYVTLGNHEFDFGVPVMQRRVGELNATVIDANFCYAADYKPVFQPYTITTYGDVKVAYIGLTTPTSLAVKAMFADDEGKMKYTFMGGDGFEPYVQSIINKVRNDGADYVVVMAHLGDESEDTDITDNNSVKLINHTHGIDVVLDGHSHHVIRDSIVVDSQGRGVHLSSTGTKFMYMGVLNIGADGTVSTQLVDCNSYPHADDAVQRMVNAEKERVMEEGRQKVFASPFDVTINDANGERAVRNQETPIGNLVADAFRYVSGADICLVNGGAIRDGIDKGDVARNDIISVMPFLENVYTVEMTGQQIMDALESAYIAVPKERGDFQQISGMKLLIDTSVVPDLKYDEFNQFVGLAEASPRRVKDVRVVDKATGSYMPIDPLHTYTIASNLYQIKNLGSSAMLRYGTNPHDTGCDLLKAVIRYVAEVYNGTVPMQYAGKEGRIIIK